MIEKHAPANKKNLPIISGEWGYSTFTKGISVEKQAAFIVRQQLANLLNNVPISIWYDWKNDGENPDEREENFGIVTYDLKPKPAYPALQTLTRELSGFKIEKRIPTENDADYVLLFTNGRARKVATWTSAEPHTLSVKVESANLDFKLQEAPTYVSVN